jgi:hypothetical protein
MHQLRVVQAAEPVPLLHLALVLLVQQARELTEPTLAVPIIQAVVVVLTQQD